MSTQVMIADETDLALLGVKAVLSRSGSYQIAGLYQVLPELLDGLRRTAPQAVLLSDRLEPTLDVLALVEQVRAAAPKTHQIVMSNHADGPVIHELLRAGVAGYLVLPKNLAHILFSPTQRRGSSHEGCPPVRFDSALGHSLLDSLGEQVSVD